MSQASLNNGGKLKSKEGHEVRNERQIWIAVIVVMVFGPAIMCTSSLWWGGTDFMIAAICSIPISLVIMTIAVFRLAALDPWE